MDSKFFSFVWRHSKRDQLIILCLTIISFPLVYISLELPKIIINDAISGTDFPKDIQGFEVDQIPYLMALSILFLMMVVAINALKWLMNVRVGMTGERMLRRLRYLLFERVMLFRMTRFRQTKSGEIIQSILGEIEPLGGFIGEVIATPAFQGGLLIVYTTFIFMQDAVLGAAAIALLPIQAYIIPKLQAKIVRLNKERARNTRKLADTIGESVNVISEVHTNDTARWHMAQVAGRLYENTIIRLQLFERKFTIKALNNFINQLTPFFFYSVGGYLVIKGQLDLGSLIAVLVAYKEVAAPWKAVLNYMQRWTDFNSRYVFVVENFSGDDVLTPERIYADGTDAEPLSGALEFRDVEGGPGTGGLTAPDLVIASGQMVAVTGGSGGGREALLKLAAGLQQPIAGRVIFGGKALVDCTLPQVGATVAYVGSEPGIVARSMRDNLLYGLLRGAPELADQTDAALVDMLREARLTGNSTAHPEGDWVDYSAAGVDGPDALDARLLELIELVGLSGELYSSALDARLDTCSADAWTDRIMRARKLLHDAGQDLSDLVEDWEEGVFNTNGTLLENALFALPVDAPSTLAECLTNPAIRQILSDSGGLDELAAVGLDIAREFSELVDALDEDSAVLDGFAGYTKSEIMAAHELVVATAGQEVSGLDKAQRDLVTTLGMSFVPVRDRLDVLDDARIAKLMDCRTKARELLANRDDFISFVDDRFSPAQTVAENILHAKRRFDRKSAWKKLEAMMEDAIDEAGLREDLIRLGLDAKLSSSGGLSNSSRRRVALVRGLIKRPRLMVLDGIAGSDTPADAELRAAIKAELPDTTILYAALEDTAIAGVDGVAAIAEDGVVRLEDAPASKPSSHDDQLTE
ncbi:MAG: ABC transporter transmembrane domain-containing protein [Pseudomonadota bacterium]